MDTMVLVFAFPVPNAVAVAPVVVQLTASVH